MVLIEALSASGFLDLRKVADAEERVRRLVRRLNLPSRDADVDRDYAADCVEAGWKA